MVTLAVGLSKFSAQRSVAPMTNSHQVTEPKQKNASDINLEGLWGRLPQNWHPYITIMRLDRPIGWQLLVLPGLWAIWAAAPFSEHSNWMLMASWFSGLFIIGAIIMRAAGCVINDLWDRDLDKKIARTASRPLASGAISQTKALTLLVILGLIGFAILLQLPLRAWAVGIASLPFIAIYPLFKRFTYWPQIMLGLTFSWGILLGYTSITNLWPNFAMCLLYFGTVFWVVGYDTIYAIQDIKDDAANGIKSSALALKGKIALSLQGIYGSALLLMAAGFYVHYGKWGIWTIGLALMGLHLFYQTRRVKEDDASMALRLFKSNAVAGLICLIGLCDQALLILF